MRTQRIKPNNFDKPKTTDGSGEGSDNNDEFSGLGELAYPCAAGKFHKPKLAWRFIACSSLYTIRALSMWLTLAFKALMPVVNNLWDVKMSQTGISSFGSWIAKDSSHMPRLIERMNNNIPSTQRGNVRLRAFDFSKMYTILI